MTSRTISPFAATRRASHRPFPSLFAAWQGGGLVLLVLLAITIVTSACGSDEDRLGEFMKRGESYVADENYDEAVIEFKNALQIDPNHAAAHEALSLIYGRVGKPREAYWEMSETVRLDPDNVPARLRYAAISLIARNIDVALEQANAVIGLEPDNPRPYLLRSQVNEQKEMLDDAEADLRKSVELSKGGVNFRIALAGFLERQERYGEAEAELRNVIEQAPNSFLAINGLAGVLARDETRDAETEKVLRRAVDVALVMTEETADQVEISTEELEANGRQLIVEPPRARIEAYRGFARFYFLRDRLDDAKAILREGIEKVDEGKSDLIYQLARLHRTAGETEQANAVLREAAEADPDSAGPRLVLSAFLGEQNDLEGALAAAQEAVDVEPKNSAALLRKAELLVDVGFRASDDEKVAEGGKIVDDVLEREPSNSAAFFVRGKIELARNDVDSAIESLSRAVEGREEWAQAHLVLGSAYMVKGDRKKARASLARAVELDPNLLEARRLLTQVHAELGEHEYAIEEGRRYLKARPDDDATRIIVAQSLVRIRRPQEAYQEVSKIPDERRGPEAFYALARLDVAAGNLEKARKSLSKAVEVAPYEPKLLGLLVAIDRAQNHPDRSTALVDAALAARPDDSELHALVASIDFVEGRLDEAEAGYKRAIELDPTNVDASRQLARIYQASGRIDQTITLYEAAIRARPELAQNHLQLALLYEMDGRREDAVRAYEATLERNPNSGEALNNLAYLLAEEGEDLDRALELAREAKEQMPDNPSAADTLGWVLYKRGVVGAAIGYLQEAIDSVAKDDTANRSVIRHHLSLAYEANGETQKAIETSRAALQDLESHLAQQRAKGAKPGEPEWASEARAMIERLEKEAKG